MLADETGAYKLVASTHSFTQTFILQILGGIPALSSTVKPLSTHSRWDSHRLQRPPSMPARKPWRSEKNHVVQAQHSVLGSPGGLQRGDIPNLKDEKGC